MKKAQSIKPFLGGFKGVILAAKGADGTKPKRSKYGSKRVEIDGIKYDSKIEATRGQSLKIRERIGEIRNLQHHVVFPLYTNGIKTATYEADFVYWIGNTRIIEDVKGVQTDVFRLKAKHMAAQGDPVTLWPDRKTRITNA